MSEGPSTVIKALSLLEFFSEGRPHVGLSELAKLSGYNKASTLRFLTALQLKGFVEQDEATKTYSIGPAFLRFAQVREATLPMEAAVQTVLRDLSAATGETAHVSLIMGETLANIGCIESRRANRVSIRSGETMPFHATSSGQVVLAFLESERLDEILAGDLPAYASETATDPREIRARLDGIRAQGFARSSASYEDGVTGVAAPYFGPSGRVCGAVAVAMPTARATARGEAAVVAEVRVAARRLTALRGGFHPESFPDIATGANEEPTT